MPITGVLQSSDAVTDGYVLFSPIASNIAYLIDNDGEIVHQWESPYAIMSPYLMDNGDLLAAVIPQGNPDFPVGRTGRVERYNWDGELLWSFDLSDDNQRLHHDIEPMPDGHILMHMWERVSPDEFANYGLSADNIPGDNQDLFYDNIIEVDPLTNEIVWQWRLLDHSIQQVDDSLPNYGIPSEHPQLIDLNFVPRPDTLDRSHINAIAYNPELDQLILSVHYYSEIWIISRETGDIIYRWGNPAAYGYSATDNQRLYLQHDPTWQDNGNIMVFNNGNEVLRPYSNVLEITASMNADGSYQLPDISPADPLIVYQADPPESFFAINTSNAQRLANGHIFINDGPHGRLFEVDTEGNIVWEYQSPVWLSNAPFQPIIFRAYRIMPEHPALQGRNLISQGQIPYITPEQ